VESCLHILYVRTKHYIITGRLIDNNPTRFPGSMKYPSPSKKAALKIGMGGDCIVFLIFHRGKEYAVEIV